MTEETVTVDFSNLVVEAREDFVDSNGEAREDALIQKDKIVCHPSMKDRLEEALRLFFYSSSSSSS